jgi:hypothetical protein
MVAQCCDDRVHRGALRCAASTAMVTVPWTRAVVRP